MDYNSLATTTHPLYVNLPSSGQQGTARLSARKTYVARGNRAQDTLVRDTTLVSVCVGFSSYAISVNSLLQINLHHPASLYLAGHLNDISLQHLPGLLGVRVINRGRGEDPVRSSWRLYRACRRLKKQRATSNVQPAGLGCVPAAALLCPISEV